MRFSELPVQSDAADHLARKLIADIGSGPYGEEELRRMVDEGCAAAVAALKALDGPLDAAKSKFDESQHGTIDMIAISMMVNTLHRAIDLIALESFLGMLGIKPPKS